MKRNIPDTQDGKYKRCCPVCNCELYHNRKYERDDSEIKKRTCRKCKDKAQSINIRGENNPRFGKTFTPEQRARRSELLSGKNHPLYGVKMSDSTKNKISNSLKGKKHSVESRINMSLAAKGRIHTPEAIRLMSLNHSRLPRSEEVKRKCRTAVVKKIKDLGYLQLDRGATEFFKHINKNGFNFQPTYFYRRDDCGYVADGYDSEKHIWCEFDTPYHNYPYQQKKDLVRQNNIIKHYESLNRPLNLFIRVKADKDGNVLGTRCVYSKPIKKI